MRPRALGLLHRTRTREVPGDSRAVGLGSKGSQWGRRRDGSRKKMELTD